MKKVLLIIALVFIIILASALFYGIDKEKETETKNENTINNIVESNVENINNQKQSSDPKAIKTKVEFNDNECIAIGYVTDSNETKFANTYFENGEYEKIAYYDFREEPVNPNNNYGNKFVIIPINEKVKISVYNCHIDEEGNLYTDEELTRNVSEPFIMINDYIEYIPKICVKFEYNGFEDMFPITFSGEDGSLVLTGHEMEVKDISLQENN